MLVESEPVEVYPGAATLAVLLDMKSTPVDVRARADAGWFCAG
jgi:hypothetical protein